jgi:phospholipid transport system transporter-binding protein
MIVLPAQATLEHSAALAATLPESVAADSGVLCVDASKLEDFDTSTVALLMQARRLAHAAGRGFQVVGAPRQLAQLAQLYGVEELLSLSDACAGPASPRVETGSAVSA